MSMVITSPATTNHQQTVLVIDDGKEICRELHYVLAQVYDTQFAHSLEDGLSMIAEQLPQLVIPDLGLPDQMEAEGVENIRGIENNLPVADCLRSW